MPIGPLKLTELQLQFATKRAADKTFEPARPLSLSMNDHVISTNLSFTILFLNLPAVCTHVRGRENFICVVICLCTYFF